MGKSGGEQRGGWGPGAQLWKEGRAEGRVRALDSRERCVALSVSP